MYEVGDQIKNDELFNRQKAYSDYSSRIKVVVDQLKSPENLASVYRVADAAGCKHIILLDDNNWVKNSRFKKIARSTEKFIKTEIINKTEFLKSHDNYHPLVAVEITTGSRNLFNTELPSSCTLVIGNENNGIDKELLALCQQAVHVPMFGNNGSMNVSHALAIVLFEWRRQMS